MKKTVLFLIYSLALTVVFYEIADYFIPGSPSETITILLAGLAVVLVWIVQCFIRVSRLRKDSVNTTVVR